MDILYAATMLLALAIAQLLLFGMITRRLPSVLRALSGEHAPRESHSARVLRL